MFVEWPKGSVHLSLRSKERVDVSLIALNHDGGGHARAAGCSVSDAKLDELMNDVITEEEQAIAAAC